MLSIVFLVLTAANLEHVDVTEVLPNLALWSDGKGHYIAAHKGFDRVFYGDGKTFYESSPFATSTNDAGSEATLRDQRYDSQSQTELSTMAGDGTLSVACGKRSTKLVSVPADKAKAVLGKATFNRSPHNFKPYALARDDKGTYYFVDHGRYDDNDRVFRVFIGPRGNMQEQKLTNIVHDSAGDIFATPKGDLRLVVGDQRTTEWIREEVHVKLLDLPVQDNVTMIYNDLGVYKKLRLGSPCDDL